MLPLIIILIIHLIAMLFKAIGVHKRNNPLQITAAIIEIIHLITTPICLGVFIGNTFLKKALDENGQYIFTPGGAIFLAFFILLGLIIAGFLSYNRFIYYFSNRGIYFTYGNRNTITLKEFRQYQSLAPNKWDIDNTYGRVRYKKSNYYSEYTNWFYFPFYDYRKLIAQQRREEYQKNKKTKNDAYIDLLNYVQKDIDEIREKSIQEQEEAIRAMQSLPMFKFSDGVELVDEDTKSTYVFTKDNYGSWHIERKD